MSSSGPANLPLSLLVSVLSRVPGLLTLITPYLFPRHKLTELSRLCRSFPPLSPACFRHDQLDLSQRAAVILPHLNQSRFTRALLSQIRHVRCVYSKVSDAELPTIDHHLLALFHPSPSPRAAPFLPVFPSLRSFAITVSSHDESFMQRLFASSSYFPYLSKLDVSCESNDDVLPSLDVQPLCGLPSLTSLTLRCCSISRRGFASLCALPLSKLDCTDQCDLVADEGDEDTEYAVNGESDGSVLSTSLRVLLFPGMKYHFDFVDRLLRAYISVQPKHDEVTEKGDDGDVAALPRGLLAVQVFNEDIPTATMRLICAIKSLTWLDMSDCYVYSLEPMVDEKGKPRLAALKHFDAPLYSADPDGQDADDQRRREEAAETVWKQYLETLSAYAPQLHLLQLNLQLNESAARVVVAMLTAALCSINLREFSLGVWSGPEQHDAADGTWLGHYFLSLPHVGNQPVLQHVGDLVLYGLPIGDEALSCLLQLLPNVQDCRLADHDYVSLNVLPSIARSCPKLRKLEMIAEAHNRFLQLPLTDSVWTANDEHAVVFPSLLTFVVAGRHESLSYDKAHLQPLARFLSHSARNLRYLYLDINCPLHLLAPFSALPSLRAFRAFKQLPPTLSRFFRRPPLDERAHVWSEYHRDRPQYNCEVMSVEEMEGMELVRDVSAEGERNGQQHRDDCYVFASEGGRWASRGCCADEEVGQWGRRGFFEAVSAIVPEGSGSEVNVVDKEAHAKL